MAILHVITGDYAGNSYQLSAKQMVIGRYAFCDIVFDDHSISREHAQIVCDGDQFFIEDLGSLNGTYLNGERLQAREQLADNDHIRCFKTEMRFYQADQPPRGARGRQSEESPPEEEAESHQSPTFVMNMSSDTPLQSEKGSAHMRLKAVIEFTRSLGNTLAIDEILPQIIDSAFRIFPQSERGYILRGGDSSGGLTPFAIRHHRAGSEIPPTFGPLNQRLARQVLEKGEAMLIDDALSSEEEHSVLDEQFRSTICAPIMGPSRNPLGVIHIETNDSSSSFNYDDLEVLASVASIAGQAIEYAMLHEARLQHDRRKRELAMAKEVQKHFIPNRLPTAKNFRFYHHYRPAQEVGGDYFGYIPLQNDRLALAIGDVAGKGVSAALLMAKLCSEVRYTLASSATPEEAVGKLAEEIAGPSGDLCFVTFAMIILDPNDTHMTVVNAGHMPPLVRRKATGKVEAVGAEQSGFPLGFHLQRKYQACQVELNVGDVVLLYTDGVSEALNLDGKVFTNARVKQLLAKCEGTVRETGRHIVEEIDKFSAKRAQSDDACLLCFTRKE